MHLLLDLMWDIGEKTATFSTQAIGRMELLRCERLQKSKSGRKIRSWDLVKEVPGAVEYKHRGARDTYWGN